MEHYCPYDGAALRNVTTHAAKICPSCWSLFSYAECEDKGE